MRILFLGEPDNPLIQWLIELGENVIHTKDKIDANYCNNMKEKPEIIISYNYKHLVKEDVLMLFPNKVINLHISYLPYNRGMHPNVWSFVEKTPPGVTIHLMEKGLDTGNILVQKPVIFKNLEDPKWTLASTYDKLQEEIQSLFKKYWHQIKNGTLGNGTTQDHSLVTFHYGKELEKVQHAMINGWNTTIKDFIENLKS